MSFTWHDVIGCLPANLQKAYLALNAEQQSILIETYAAHMAEALETCLFEGWDEILKEAISETTLPQVLEAKAGGLGEELPASRTCDLCGESISMGLKVENRVFCSRKCLTIAMDLIYGKGQWDISPKKGPEN